MGKTPAELPPSDPEAQQQPHPADSHDRFSRCRSSLTPRCVFVLLLAFSAALSAFLSLPTLLSPRSRHGHHHKSAAPIKATFILHKPVSFLLPYAARLEYDIFEEIGVPSAKVSVISMRPLHSPNTTSVIFGVLHDKKSTAIGSVAKSLLKSALIELTTQQSSLSLTESIFGKPSYFNILKFPGGISVIPVQAAPIWQITRYLFSFTVNNSITDILKNLDELKGQLKIGLGLKSYENVFVQMTNLDGSTVAPPVTVQTSILSDVGTRSLGGPRLKQLAQAISGSGQNLGLNHTIFGKVKEVVLSSYLNDSITPEPPSPSPSPTSPQSVPPPTDASPSLAPTPADLPCFPCSRVAPSGAPPSLAPPPRYWSKPPSLESSSSPPSLSPFPLSPRQSPPCLPLPPPRVPPPESAGVSPASSNYLRSPPCKSINDYNAASPLPAPAPLSSAVKSNSAIHVWTVILVLVLQFLWLLNVA